MTIFPRFAIRPPQPSEHAAWILTAGGDGRVEPTRSSSPRHLVFGRIWRRFGTNRHFDMDRFSLTTQPKEPTMASATHPIRRRLVAGAGVGTFLLAAGAAGIPGTAHASSHREAPLVAGDPRADNTDVYAFVSPDKPSTVTLIANWIPFEEPNGGPNFYPFAEHAAYRINIDNNGDGHADVIYTWKFTDHYRDSSGAFLYNTGVVNHLSDPTLNFFQTYNLVRRANGKSV